MSIFSARMRSTNVTISTNSCVVIRTRESGLSYVKTLFWCTMTLFFNFAVKQYIPPQYCPDFDVQVTGEQWRHSAEALQVCLHFKNCMIPVLGQEYDFVYRCLFITMSTRYENQNMVTDLKHQLNHKLYDYKHEVRGTRTCTESGTLVRVRVWAQVWILFHLYHTSSLYYQTYKSYN